MSARRGVLVLLILLAVLGGAVLFAAFAIRKPTREASSNVLVWNVPFDLAESEVAPRSRYSLESFLPERPTLYEYVRAIHHAAADDRIEALVLHIDAIDWGWAKVEEVRDAIAAFRASGKPVYASLAGGGEREYLLATSAGTLSSPPMSILRLDGLVLTAMFYRGTLDKLGVRPNFAHIGQYKSGVEPFTRTEMSPSAREANEALLDSEYRLLLDSLAVARATHPDSIRHLLDEGPYTSEEAATRGLVDTVLYRSDLDSIATRRTRAGELTMTRYLDRVDEPVLGFRIALVSASGVISGGRSRVSPGEGTVLGSETIVRALRDVRNRPSVKAVVLRIDSPGGEVQASDEIWREIARCRARKPVIASLSDVAASGGYYLAVAADSIVARPSTITGSIGVFGGKLNILGLYHKLGLSIETLTRGRHAEMLSPYRDFTPEEASEFEANMAVVYRTFLDRVARGRGMRPEEVDSVAQGRVWTGIDARDRGLVDALGGLETAFEMARAKAGGDPDEDIVIETWPRPARTFWQRVFASMLEDDDEDLEARVALPEALRTFLAAARFPAGAALALMPYSLEIR